MSSVEVGPVTLDYGEAGSGEPILLVAGDGQPALSWQLSLVPALVAAGRRVVWFDNRGMAPSSSPPGPYTVADMVGDSIGLLDHLGLERVDVVGYSMGGWIAEVLAAEHPDRIRASVLIGSCNASSAWEKATYRLARDLAAIESSLPPLFWAVDTLRYLPQHELQRDDVVESWLELLAADSPWPNPGHLGQADAIVSWAEDPGHAARWARLRGSVLVLAFEYDTDSPPLMAREAADVIVGARYRCIDGAGHLGVFTHGDEVAGAIVEFLDAVTGNPTTGNPSTGSAATGSAAAGAP